MNIETLTESQLFVTKHDLRSFLNNTCTKYSISYRDKTEWIRLNTEFTKRIDYEKLRLQREYRDQLLTAPTITALGDLVATINSTSATISDISEKASRIVRMYNNLKNGGGHE